MPPKTCPTCGQKVAAIMPACQCGHYFGDPVNQDSTTPDSNVASIKEVPTKKRMPKNLRLFLWASLIIIAISLFDADEKDTPSVTQPQKSTVSSQHKQFHTIKAGETLSDIALKYGIDWRKIADWNGIENPNALEVGQKLAIYNTGQKPIQTEQKVKEKPLTTTPPKEKPSTPTTPIANAKIIKGCYGYVEQSDMEDVLKLIMIGGRSLERAKSYVNREEEKMVFLPKGLGGHISGEGTVNIRGFVVSVKKFHYSGLEFWVNKKCLG